MKKLIDQITDITVGEILSAYTLDNRVINIFEPIYDYVALDVISKIQYMNIMNSEEPITINISSPGGSCYAGLAMYDAMINSRAPIHTVGTGWVMSMGSILLVAGAIGFRTTTKNCTIMLHEPSGGGASKTSDVVIEAAELSRIKKLMAKIYVDRSDGRLTKKTINKLLQNDSYLIPEDALAHGLIDGIN